MYYHWDPCLCEHCGAFHWPHTMFKSLCISPKLHLSKMCSFKIGETLLVLDNLFEFEIEKKNLLKSSWVKRCLKLID